MCVNPVSGYAVLPLHASVPVNLSLLKLVWIFLLVCLDVCNRICMASPGSFLSHLHRDTSLFLCCCPDYFVAPETGPLNLSTVDIREGHWSQKLTER